MKVPAASALKLPSISIAARPSRRLEATAPSTIPNGVITTKIAKIVHRLTTSGRANSESEGKMG